MDQIIGNLSLLVQFPIVNLNIILQGVLIGSIFVLAAYGLALVWGVMNVKNLAQGDFVIAGGYASWWSVENFGINPLLGVPPAITSPSRWCCARFRTASITWWHPQPLPHIN